MSEFEQKAEELSKEIKSFKAEFETAQQKKLEAAVKEMRANLGLPTEEEESVESKTASYAYGLEAAIEKKRQELGLVEVK
jgi:predicted  nucleic acid-binding Zn-ribbon protein